MRSLPLPAPRSLYSTWRSSVLLGWLLNDIETTRTLLWSTRLFFVWTAGQRARKHIRDCLHYRHWPRPLMWEQRPQGSKDAGAVPWSLLRCHILRREAKIQRGAHLYSHGSWTPPGACLRDLPMENPFNWKLVALMESLLSLPYVSNLSGLDQCTLKTRNFNPVQVDDSKQIHKMSLGLSLFTCKWETVAFHRFYRRWKLSTREKCWKSTKSAARRQYLTYSNEGQHPVTNKQLRSWKVFAFET